MENRFIKPSQDVEESVEVIGKRNMDPWQFVSAWTKQRVNGLR